MDDSAMMFGALALSLAAIFGAGTYATNEQPKSTLTCTVDGKQVVYTNIDRYSFDRWSDTYTIHSDGKMIIVSRTPCELVVPTVSKRK